MNKSFKRIWIISIYLNIASIVFFFLLVNRFFVDGMIVGGGLPVFSFPT